MTLPIVGAALDHQDLEAHRAWLLEAPRDLEIQSFVDAEVLDSDWSGLAAETLRLIDVRHQRPWDSLACLLIGGFSAHLNLTWS